MARQYAKVFTFVWGSDFRTLSRDAQYLYLLIISNPKLSPAGVLTYQPRKWARYSVGTEAPAIEAAFEELRRAAYLIHDEDTDEVLVRSFIRHDRGYRNQFLRKSIVSSIDAVESVAIADQARRELDACLQGGDDDPTEDPYEDSSDESCQDPYEDSSDESCQDPYEGATEDTWQANYRLQPQHQPSTSTGNHQPGASSADTEPSPQGRPDDDPIGTIIDAIIAARTAGRTVTDPIAHLRACRANFAAKERLGLDMMLAARPHFLTAEPGMVAQFYLASSYAKGAA